MSIWGSTDQANNKPKFLTTAEATATVGVSVSEANLQNNRAAGLKTPGWTQVMSYTDAQGNQRTKTNVLVALKGGLTADAADDVIVSDRTITITTQPQSVSVAAGSTAVFSVVASVVPATAATYQWQKQESGTRTWSNIVDATAASYTTGALTVADDSGDKYRVMIGAADARPVYSTVANLQVTAA